MARPMQVTPAGIVLMLAACATAVLARMNLLTVLLAAAGAINAAEVLIVQARRYHQERLEQRLEGVNHEVDQVRITLRFSQLGRLMRAHLG
jgi:TolA-binding protein